MSKYNHPPEVFSSMKFIMTLVLTESEEISFDLFTLLLSSVKREKKVKKKCPLLCLVRVVFFVI